MRRIPTRLNFCKAMIKKYKHKEKSEIEQRNFERSIGVKTVNVKHSIFEEVCLLCKAYNVNFIHFTFFEDPFFS
jgi:hypothetical protein